jgi:hypothetical protein
VTSDEQKKPWRERIEALSVATIATMIAGMVVPPAVVVTILIVGGGTQAAPVNPIPTPNPQGTHSTRASPHPSSVYLAELTPSSGDGPERGDANRVG